MSRPLLDLVSERVEHGLLVARRNPLLDHLGAWLGVVPEPAPWRPPDGIRRYLDVAEAAVVFAVKGDNESREFLAAGLDWLRKRRFFVPDQPSTLEGDPIALVALAVGLEAQSQDDGAREWLLDVASRARSQESEPRRSDLFALASAIVRHDAEAWSLVSPLLLVATAVRTKAAPTQPQQQAALDAIVGARDFEPEWAVLSAAALAAVLSRGATVDLRRPTMDQVVELLRCVPAALKRWPWEDKPKTQGKGVTAQRWDIQHEYHVQSLLWAILRSVLTDLEDEEYLPSLGHKHPRADLLIPSLRLIVEVKFLRDATQAARANVIEEVAADAGLYLTRDSRYDQIVPFIWDDSASNHHHAEMISGLRKIRGVADAVIVSRSGEWRV